ncbi:hypothetical protein VT84_34725 [Gemmata sp. SH-PL17]|uniref:hypothetical protein n=1 Tax=Gemmata sp. SH-PL17 TaxID=1630693 RepID=UPI00078D7ACB|nr:hypothetical protein [Gemmata sp. SH-PL17]AMV29601.1 hypothetical protein VT84_34725 [Gemmata sp. SH-PL17]
MTEQDWLNGTDPTPMLEFLKGNASERKLRLFAVACCRSIWHLLTDERSRIAVDVFERLVDGLATTEEVQEADKLACAVETAHVEAAKLGDDADEQAWDIVLDGCAAANAVQTWRASEYLTGFYTVYGFAQTAVAHAACPLRYETSRREHTPERTKAIAVEANAQSRLIRDIVGNPFRPVTVDASWLTSTVVAPAEGIYQDRAFDRLPILADALQDAGCDNPDVLNHCRGDGPHCRGCWVIDLLTGRK